MTHPSGLQYSYDDLDLVCCHGVEGDGQWMGSGSSKPGRRARCASMPEGCHQLPVDDLTQACEGTAPVMNNNTELQNLKLMENNGKDLQELVQGSYELSAGILPTTSNSEHLQATNTGNFGEFRNSNSGMSTANVSCATHSSDEAIKNESDFGRGSCQNHSVCDDSVFKSADISQQQCVSISSNNGPPLSECAGEQPGKFPNHQNTKESHTEGYSRPPEISGAAVNWCSAGELKPQADLPDVEKGRTVTSDQAGVSVSVLQSSADMEGGEAFSPINKTAESLVADEERGKGISESCGACSADKLDGLRDLETLNENTGVYHQESRVIQGEEQDRKNCAGPLDQDQGWEISYQTSLEKHDVEMTAENWLQGEKHAQGESSKKAGHVRPSESSNFINHDCSSVEGNVPSEKMSSGHAGECTGTNTMQCANEDVKSSAIRPVENTNQSLLPVDVSTPHETEYSCPKLDTIPEIGTVEVTASSLSDAQKNNDVNITPDPAAEHCCSDDKHEITEKHTANLPPSSAEVNEGLHGNQASGPHFNESPASEVTDGHREHHRPGATLSKMKESNEDARSVIDGDTQDASSPCDGTCADQKEDKVAKVRLRKVRLRMIYCRS